jgi:cupin fold WbuC family metalloprotein
MKNTSKNGYDTTAAVIVPEEDIVCVRADDLLMVKDMADGSALRRARICAHKDICDTVHEMIIVMLKDSYVAPHRHANKTESFHIIEGRLHVVVFDEAGEITQVIAMTDYASGGVFFYRLPENRYHTVLPVTDRVVFHECTSGPFDKNKSVNAPFSPDESDPAVVRSYVENLIERIKAWNGEKQDD